MHSFLKYHDVACLKMANYSQQKTINSLPQYLAFLEKNYKRYMFTYEEAFLSNGYFIAPDNNNGLIDPETKNRIQQVIQNNFIIN